MSEDWIQAIFYFPPGSEMLECIKDTMRAQGFEFDSDLIADVHEDGTVVTWAPCPPYPM